MEQQNKTKNRVWFLLPAVLHWLITFFTDRFVFTVRPADELFNYTICKVLLLLLILFLYRTLYRIFFSENRKESVEYQTAKYALFYLIPIVLVLMIKLPQGFLSNDEALIFKEASQLASYTWFYYLTTYYYIVTMMLIPCSLGPILFKVALQLAVCGYCVYRLCRYLENADREYSNASALSGHGKTGSFFGKFLYLAFLLPPVLAYTTSAHRIPVYYLLYLLMIFVLLMDYLEQKTPTKGKLAALLILGAVLTQWRTEGIYLIVFVPVLLILSYRTLRHKKQAFLLILASLAIQYVITIPQNGALIPDRLNDQAENRMGPFYAYTITNMYRNGLDLQKNAADLKEVNRYLSVDTIAAINQDLKDINYEDVLILYYEGYTGTQPDATPEDYQAYVDACNRIFIHNPLVLLKTRIGAFHYAATPYRIVWPTGGFKGLISFGISIIKTCAYNLYVPHLILICLWLYSVFRRRPFTFFLTSGLLCHWLIVFVLAPASYFKYYFPIYMTMYFYLILLIIGAVYKKCRPGKTISFLV